MGELNFIPNYHLIDEDITSTDLINDESYFLQNPVIAAFFCVFVSLLILATIVGNAMVCLAIFMVRKLKQQPANLLLISLAVADFSVGLLVMPIALIYMIEDRWMLGDFLCRFWTSADLTLCTASILNLCLISVDRYLVVTRPLRYCAKRTRRRMLGYIAIVWIGALFVSVTPLIVLPWSKIENTCQVPQNQVYQIYATIISFYGPCLIMVILYIQMWRAAKRLCTKDRLATKWSLTIRDDPNHNENNYNNSNEIVTELSDMNGNGTCKDLTKKRPFHRPSTFLNVVRTPLVEIGILSIFGNKAHLQMHSRSTEKGEDKARKTLGVIMSVFIICWLPFFILALLKSQNLVTSLPKWLDILTLWLGYFNSMLNPLIYCKYNREFRVPFREMLCCRFRTIQNVMRNESFKSKYGPPRFFELKRKGTTDDEQTSVIDDVFNGQICQNRVDHI
uniref:G-protein coupled receptors family 1 profile domain-containing protein n=1 Tax=Panagrolaimus sp. JU765 TaxID=591449 RepID=A0AC34QVW5_9BILA